MIFSRSLALVVSIMLPLQVNTLPMAQSASQHGLPFSLPAVKPPTQNLELLTDGLLFNISLDSFNEYRSGQPVDYLDWTSDGCTQSPESPLGFNFFPACHRHDFGYQNYINQQRFTTEGKAKVDANFKNDLVGICSAPDLMVDKCRQCASTPKPSGVNCNSRALSMCKFPPKDVCVCLADIYYKAVSSFGGEGKIQPGHAAQTKRNVQQDGRFHARRGNPLKDLIDHKVQANMPKFDIVKLGLCLAQPRS